MDNEIPRTSREKQMTNILHEYFDNCPWLMPLIYGLLILCVTMKNFHAWHKRKVLFFCHMQFLLLSLFWMHLSNSVRNEYGIICINSFRRFSGFLALIKSFFVSNSIPIFFMFDESKKKKFTAHHKSRQKFNDSTVSKCPSIDFV